MPGLNFFSSFLSAFYFTNIRPLLPASHTQTLPGRLIQRAHTAQIIKFFIKKFFSKCDRIRRKLRIWSHLLKKFLTENFIFCAMSPLHTAGLKPGTFGFRVQLLTTMLSALTLYFSYILGILYIFIYFIFLVFYIYLLFIVPILCILYIFTFGYCLATFCSRLPPL